MPRTSSPRRRGHPTGVYARAMPGRRASRGTEWCSKVDVWPVTVRRCPRTAGRSDARSAVLWWPCGPKRHALSCSCWVPNSRGGLNYGGCVARSGTGRPTAARRPQTREVCPTIAMWPSALQRLRGRRTYAVYVRMRLSCFSSRLPGIRRHAAEHRLNTADPRHAASKLDFVSGRAFFQFELKSHSPAVATTCSLESSVSQS